MLQPMVAFSLFRKINLPLPGMLLRQNAHFCAQSIERGAGLARTRIPLLLNGLGSLIHSGAQRLK